MYFASESIGSQPESILSSFCVRSFEVLTNFYEYTLQHLNNCFQIETILKVLVNKVQTFSSQPMYTREFPAVDDMLVHLVTSICGHAELV